jgi:hypothetical protein
MARKSLSLIFDVESRTTFDIRPAAPLRALRPLHDAGV